MKSRLQNMRVSFFGQVDAESSAAPPCAQQEAPHDHVQHDAPQALQPPHADKKTLGARTNHPAMDAQKRKPLSSHQFTGINDVA